MNIEIYPNCPITTRTVLIGGLSRAELLTELRHKAIQLNESGERLFASELFTTSASRSAVTTIELTVAKLGFPAGATTAAIYTQAAILGLGLCPLELGPHLRLQYLDQPEGFVGQPIRPHQAPIGSITIASAPLIENDDFPKGFYLRRIEGVLWLRGYHAGVDHIWQADDHLIFCKM